MYGSPTGGSTTLRWRAALFSAIFLLAAVLAGCSFGGDEPKGKAQGTARASSGVSGGAPDDEPVAQVAEQLSPSVVQVNIRAVEVTPFGAREGEGVGSGVVYRSDGYIVTNNHVVAPPGSGE